MANRKPPLGARVNWGHPRAKGLVFCGLMTSQGYYDAVSGQTYRERGSGVSFTAGERDGASSHNNATPDSRVRTGVYDPVKTQAVSVVARVKFGSASGNNGIVESTGPGEAVNAKFLLFRQGTEQIFRICDGGGTSIDCGTTTGAGSTEWQTLGGSYISGAHSVYQNGVARLTTAPAIAFTAQNGEVLIGHLGTSYYPMDGQISWVVIYDRRISDEEHKYLHDFGPYAFLTSVSQMLPTVRSNVPTLLALTGAVSSSGTLLKQTQRSLAGSVATAGTLLKQTYRALTGAVTSSGALSAVKTALLALTGAVTISGTLVKQTQRSLTGSIATAGTLLKQTLRSLTGAVTSSGALAVVKTALLSLTGAVSSSGTLIKQTRRALTGSVANAGALAWQVQKVFTGTVSSAGTLVKRTSRALTGTVTSAGALATVKAALKALEGSVTIAGTLVKRTSRSFIGSVTTVGTLIKQAQRALTGAVTSSGTLTSIKTALVSLVGSVATVGTLSRRTARALVGSVATEGSLAKRTARALAGSVVSVGSLSKQAARFVTGSVASAGTLVKRISRELTGSVASVGTLVKLTRRALTGAVSIAGTLSSVVAGVYITLLGARNTIMRFARGANDAFRRALGRNNTLR